MKHPRKGATVSDETKTKISRANKGKSAGDRNPMKKGHTEASKEKMSDTRTRLMIEGRVRPYGKMGHVRGDYTSQKTGMTMFHRSSWELALMEHLDADDTVVTYQHEGVRIPYYYNDNKRWYVPDFIVTYRDGHREMLEIKPREFMDDEKTRLKAEAGRAYCSQSGIDEYRMLTRGDLIGTHVIPCPLT